MSLSTSDTLTLVGSRASLRGQFAGLWRYRELLAGLVRKELKVKYKGSALGFLWSMLNPLLYLGVFYLVFDVFLSAGIPRFEIFMLSGLLAWNLFNTALAAATSSVVANASLVNKVWFPRTILPLASVGASMVHFFLQTIVLLLVLVVSQYNVAWSYMPLIVPALLALVLFTGALAVLLSAVNVYARDTQHLLELALLAWFWMTPIIYPYRLVADKIVNRGLPDWLFLLNPLTSVVITFQRAIYGRVGGTAEAAVRGIGGRSPEPGLPAILPADATQWWYLRNLLVLGLASVVLLVVALVVFSRLEGNFAEEL